MKVTPLIFLSLCFFSSGLVASALAAQPYPIGQAMEFLEDKTGALTIGEVSSATNNFKKGDKQIQVFGQSKSAFWVKIPLELIKGSEEKWNLKINSNEWSRVQFYSSQGGGLWQLKEAGRALAFDSAVFINSSTLFRLPYPLNEETRVYVRLESDIFRMMSGQGMVFDAHLISEKKHQEDTTWDFYLRGMFYGFFLIMVINNLFLFLSIRDASYLFYAFYLAALVPFFMIFDGLFTPYFWAKETLLLEGKMISVTFSVFSVFFILFVKSFLNTKVNAPKMDKLLSLTLVFNVVAAATVYFLPYFSITLTEISASNTIVMFMAVFAVGFLCWKQGYRPARYFLLAASSFVGPTLVATFATFPFFSFLADYSILMVKLGAVSEALLYSFALAERFKFERQQKEESQALAISNLLKADQIKDAFLANTSHELRTPLHGMIGIAEATMENMGRQDAKALQSNLSLIVSSGRRLSLLVNDILDLSKLKHKEIPLNFQPIPIHRVIESVTALSQTLIGKKDVKLVNEATDKVALLVIADEPRLELILFNLVSNGIKFTSAGTVTIAAEQFGNKLVISVTDTGIGIPQDQQALIFNAFEQVDGSAARQYEGTGLGLSICKQLVELHKSELSLSSELGSGSSGQSARGCGQLNDRKDS